MLACVQWSVVQGGGVCDDVDTTSGNLDEHTLAGNVICHRNPKVHGIWTWNPGDYAGEVPVRTAINRDAGLRFSGARVDSRSAIPGGQGGLGKRPELQAQLPRLQLEIHKLNKDPSAGVPCLDSSVASGPLNRLYLWPTFDDSGARAQAKGLTRRPRTRTHQRPMSLNKAFGQYANLRDVPVFVPCLLAFLKGSAVVQCIRPRFANSLSFCAGLSFSEQRSVSCSACVSKPLACRRSTPPTREVTVTTGLSQSSRITSFTSTRCGSMLAACGTSLVGVDDLSVESFAAAWPVAHPLGRWRILVSPSRRTMFNSG